MISLERLIADAKQSTFGLWLLNQALKFVIPFNRPHGIRVKKFSNLSIETFLPYRYNNRNHVKGTHACALAAAAEFSTGILLLSHLSPSRYRLLMQKLSVEYHYQARMDAVASCSLDPLWLMDDVIDPLVKSDRVTVVVKSLVHDINHNHLCTAEIIWQIKEWK